MYRIWTDEEIDYISDNYKTVGDVAIAKHLNRTKKAVYSKRRVLGLERTKKEIYDIQLSNANRRNFKYLHKGRKVGEVFYKENYQCYFIKCENNRTKPYHVYLYNKHFGVVPNNHKVVLRDGRYNNLDSYRLDNITLQDKTSILYRYAMSELI